MHEPNTQRSGGSARELTIFVVDDERVIATTLELILTRMGFFVRSFVDPVEALRAAQSATPDILLTDVIMPGLNGIELANQIGRRHPHCKILLFSGEIETGELLAGARSRGYKFEILAKPIHPQVLLQKITDMIAT